MRKVSWSVLRRTGYELHHRFHSEWKTFLLAFDGYRAGKLLIIRSQSIYCGCSPLTRITVKLWIWFEYSCRGLQKGLKDIWKSIVMFLPQVFIHRHRTRFSFIVRICCAECPADGRLYNIHHYGECYSSLEIIFANGVDSWRLPISTRTSGTLSKCDGTSLA